MEEGGGQHLCKGMYIFGESFDCTDFGLQLSNIPKNNIKALALF